MLVMPDELGSSQVDEMDRSASGISGSGISGSGMEWEGDPNRVEEGHLV